MARLLLDTTVLIDALRGREAAGRLRDLRRDNPPPWVCAINVEEVWRGARPSEEKAVGLLLEALQIAPLGGAEGKLAGKWIATQLPGGKGTLGIVDTSRADASVQQIYAGLYAALKAAHATPTIKVSPPTNWDPAKALTVSANFLTANPNLDVLICFHDLVANACRQSMNAGGYKSIPLAGLGGTCQGFSNMLKGRQDFTVAQFLYSAGDLGVTDAVAVLKGKPPANRNQIAPMLGVTTADAKAILAGTKKVPAGLGLQQKIKRAAGGCK